MRKLGLIVALTLVLVAVGAGVWRSRNNHPSPSTQPLTYSIALEDSAENQAYQAAINSWLASSQQTATEASNSPADIIISSNPSPGATVIASALTGEPAKLGSSEFVSTLSQPSVYLSVAPAKLTGEEVGALATQLKSVASLPSWSLNALGDMIFGRGVYIELSRIGDYTAAVAKVKNKTRAADLTLADLECTIADGLNYPREGMTFASPAVAINALKAAGIDAVNIANNHSYNLGEAPFDKMLTTLKNQSMPYFGGGANVTQAHAPYIVTVRGIKIALLGYSSIAGSVGATDTTSGMATLSMAPWGPWDESKVKAMEADIKAAKSRADLVFVYYHWGVEYHHDANADQRKVAHRAINAGADLIIGTHPHWVQGIEWYKGKLITYSLGNFVFDQEWSVPTTQGTMLSAQFSGTKLVQAKLVPYQIHDYFQPAWLGSDPMAATILNDVYSHSWWPVN